jgi:hypothetical protein
MYQTADRHNRFLDKLWWGSFYGWLQSWLPQFHGRKKYRETVPPFRAVVPSSRIAEFRGALPRTSNIVHHLFCQRLTQKTAKAMLAEGFRGLGTRQPTHVIFCTVRLARDKISPRCLFCIYLALDEIKSVDIQDWLSLKVTLSLRDRLIENRERSFLIRCRTSREFDWCLENHELDDYWVTEASVFYRFYLRRLQKIDSIEIDEGEPTKLQ